MPRASRTLERIKALSSAIPVYSLMSLQLVQQFQRDLERLIQYGGTRNETSVRAAFQELLRGWARTHDLELVPEVAFKAPGMKNTVKPDGTLKDALRQSRGYWESKDEADTLAEEISKKFAKGYPSDNIVFEDSQTCVLIQHREEVMRADMDDSSALKKLLEVFFAFEPLEVAEFRVAIERFKADLPDLLEVLRQALSAAGSNKEFVAKREIFVQLCQQAMNPAFTAGDAGEMLIQHILTGEIFKGVFDNSQYFEDNNIAKQLELLSNTFYKSAVRRNVDTRTRTYYGAIKAAGAQIADHHEKQKFLKVLYENFYRAYNPAGADKLGIFYTPNEIVRFMIETTDALTDKHFGKSLADKGVEILDPATGTGTFITELIEYLPKSKLEAKYTSELHCNELALLPYYIANLNIEATYAQKMGKYQEFQNIVLVDTLDNTGFGIKNAQGDLFTSLTEENLERIQRQNNRAIHVIIGNPPYRANQQNENDNNKNREYQIIDQRIKETYIAASTAQKTKLYDMYSRFIRWATDRLQENGIVAFVMNRSFIESRTFDGFRKVAAAEFSHIYVVDLGGDVRANPKLSGPKHNVFAIQTGVAIAFLVRKPTKHAGAVIEYIRRPEMDTALEKLDWLRESKFAALEFDRIHPDAKHNWINQTDSNWDELLPIADKETKSSIKTDDLTSIFKLFTLGISTNRDDWVYDLSESNLYEKIDYFIQKFNQKIKDFSKNFSKLSTTEFEQMLGTDIKWSASLQAEVRSTKLLSPSKKKIIRSMYRPFFSQFYYADDRISDRFTENHKAMFGSEMNLENICLALRYGDRLDFAVLASRTVTNLNLYSADPAQCVSLYRYENGNRLDNITDYALHAFQAQYASATITRQQIFAYTYAVLHHPAYRAKYALNLRQEFPRIPYYADFAQWCAWGDALLKLHLEFETADPYALEVIETAPDTDNPALLERLRKAKLKANHASGEIALDGLTSLRGVPSVAWQYKLGNRSALEWILERYRESTPKDPTIRSSFNTYQFRAYKAQVIDLLRRVCTVSVGTMRILEAMPLETL